MKSTGQLRVLAESVAVAPDVDDMTVMDEPSMSAVAITSSPKRPQ
jgi:hypothetical protein